MNKLMPVAALAAAALAGTLSETAWSEETATFEWSAPAEQTPAPASGVVPGGYAPANPGYAQPWQQPRPWQAPQPAYGQSPPYYPAGRQYQAYPAWPAAAPTAWANPLAAELQQLQEQLAAKSSELEQAHGLLEQIRGQLQDSLATETALSDKVAYGTREQNALRVRVTDLVKTLNACNATLEQQHQLIDDHQAQNRNLSAERDQLHNELARRDEQLTAVQSELQAATQALGRAAEALSAARLQIGLHRDELGKPQAEQQNQETRLHGGPQTPTE